MHKLLTMRNILLFAVVHLLIATSVTAKTSWNPSARILTTFPEFPDKYRYHTPDTSYIGDLLDDFKLATSRLIRKTDFIKDLSIKLLEANNTKRECIVPGLDFNFMLSYERRLSLKTILILTKESEYNIFGSAWRKFVLLDIETCKYKYAHDFSMAVDPKIYTSDNSTNEKFTVIFHDKDYCRGHEYCRLFFDPMFRQSEFLDFNFDFHKDQLLINEPVTYDSHLFVVHFLENIGTYRVRLYDLSANRKGPLYRELFNIVDYKPWKISSITDYEVISSGLSFCWKSKVKSNFYNHVQCSRFRKDGSLIFNRTLIYQDSVRLIDVKTIPNGLILFSDNIRCNRTEEECSTLQVAVITKKFERIDSNPASKTLGNGLLQIKHRHYNTKCVRALYKTIRVKVQFNNSFEVQYFCKSFWSNKSIHGVFYIN